MPARLVVTMLGEVAEPASSKAAAIPSSGGVLGGGVIAVLIAMVAVAGLLWAAWALWSERPTPV